MFVQPGLMHKLLVTVLTLESGSVVVLVHMSCVVILMGKALCAQLATVSRPIEMDLPDMAPKAVVSFVRVAAILASECA